MAKTGVRRIDTIDPAIARAAEAYLDRYRLLHERIMDPSDRSVPKRYLIVPTHAPGRGGAMTNRNMGALYALFVAMLTGRALIHEPFVGSDQFYDYPIRLRMTDLPADVRERLAADPAVAALQRHIDDVGGWEHGRTMRAIDYADLKRDGIVVGDDCIVYTYPGGRCRDLTYAPANPHHRHFVAEHFGGFLFHYLARFLFRPNRRIRALAEAVRQQAAGRFLVGIHARTWQEPYTAWRGDRGLFWQTGLRAATEAGADDYAVLLATDQPANQEAARQVFGARLIHTDYDTRQCGDYESAVVDQTLLTLCDALVVTDRSSFGYFAHAVSLIQPYVVDAFMGLVYRQPHSQAGVHQKWPRIPFYWPWRLDPLAPRHVRTAMRHYAYEKPGAASRVAVLKYGLKSGLKLVLRRPVRWLRRTLNWPRPRAWPGRST